MKKILFVITLLFPCMASAQKIPPYLQKELNRIQVEEKIGLKNYYLYPNEGRLSVHGLYYSLPESMYDIASKYNLTLADIYDKEMRMRVLQLLNMEYEPFEIDTLVNRYVAFSKFSDELEAMGRCKFDTMGIFKKEYNVLIKDPVRMAKIKYIGSIAHRQYEIFKRLNLDTTNCFRIALKQINKENETKGRLYFKKNMNDYSSIAMVAGQIKDPMFIKPLIAALEKPKNFNIQDVEEALVRMRVEPYYTQYVKKRTSSIEKIKTESLDYSMNDLASVLATQESFLELSKFLLSDYPSTYEIIDRGYGSESIVFSRASDAYSLLLQMITNEDLQKRFREIDRDEKKNQLEMYKWMQKNYGKYKIRRFW